LIFLQNRSLETYPQIVHFYALDILSEIMYYVQAIEQDNLTHPKSKFISQILGRERVTKLHLDIYIKMQTGFSFFYKRRSLQFTQHSKVLHNSTS